MTQRNRTTTRGRIRISGFDSSAVEEEREFIDWDESVDSNVSADRWTRAWQRFRRNRTALLGLAVIGLMTFLAVFARPIDLFGVTVQPFAIAPYDPGASNFNALTQPPSLQHPFGTDWSGKDIFSRVLVGGRLSLTIGLIAVSLALGVGVPLGSIAGYFGGWIDEFIMRIVDVLYAFPFLVLAIAFIAIFGQGFWRMIGALVLVSWIGYARLIRGEILSVKENEYVSAAEALGARDRSIIFRHIVPNAIAPVIVQATLGIGTYVLSAAALGFLGLGLEPGSAEWGSMLSSGRESLVEGNYWITFFPGVAIFLFVLSINLVGDGVRDALDPQGDTASERLR
jgi:peptide/nickel transport system permease protein